MHPNLAQNVIFLNVIAQRIAKDAYQGKFLGLVCLRFRPDDTSPNCDQFGAACDGSPLDAKARGAPVLLIDIRRRCLCKRNFGVES